MHEQKFSLTELGLLALTRVALGVGIGLLLSKCLNEDQRRGAGIALTAAGVITTMPLLFKLVQQEGSAEQA